MAIPDVANWSTTPANNIQANTGIIWDEGMNAGQVNNSARDTMSALKVWFSAQIQGHLRGLTLSAAGSTGTFGVAAGAAADSTSAEMMSLASAYTKGTGAWAVGTGNGSLDTGSIANATWYHAHLIKRVDTGVTDILTSLSAVAPTLPTNYTVFRRLGGMLTDGSAHWAPFTQTGDLFLWNAVTQDIDFENSFSRTMQAITTKVPTGIIVQAKIRGFIQANASGAILGLIIATTDTSTTVASSPVNLNIGGPSGACLFDLTVETNTSAQIKGASNAAGDDALVRAATYGWIDTRGK